MLLFGILLILAFIVTHRGTTHEADVPRGQGYWFDNVVIENFAMANWFRSTDLGWCLDIEWTMKSDDNLKVFSSLLYLTRCGNLLPLMQVEGPRKGREKCYMELGSIGKGRGSAVACSADPWFVI